MVPNPAHGVATDRVTTNGGLPENAMGSWKPARGARQGVIQPVDGQGIRQDGAPGVNGKAKAGWSKEDLHPSWCDASAPGKEVRLNIRP